MKYFEFNKLVRDKIVDNMVKSGQKPVGKRILKGEEYLTELKKKLEEEVGEFLSVNDSQEMKEELADVFEIMKYLMKELGMSKSELKKYQQKKCKRNGGFIKKIYLESVGVSKNNEWYEYYINRTDRYPVARES